MRLLGKVIGRGTARSGRRARGDEVSVLGPLGRGFAPRAPRRARRARRRRRRLGGAPPARARSSRASPPFDVFYGGRSAARPARRGPVRAPRRAARAASCVVTTEDGSAGRRGLVTEPLAERLAAGALRLSLRLRADGTAGAPRRARGRARRRRRGGARDADGLRLRRLSRLRGAARRAATSRCAARTVRCSASTRWCGDVAGPPSVGERLPRPTCA